MPKAQRHRKRVRTARIDAAAGPLAGPSSDAAEAQTSNGAKPGQANGKKVGKKEAEVTNLLDKLRSDKVDERVWASSALSNILLTLPPVTLRLLLSKNLIGLLIERLTDAEESVAVEALGALRNLAVTSPPSIVSEMHNKRLLLPLISTHLPLLIPRVKEMLLPAAEPTTAPLPSTAEQRKQADELNAKNAQRRLMFWDWSENVFMLLWCLAESTTKILGSLNAHADKIVEFAMAYLDAGALGLSDLNEAGGMDVEAKKSKKGKKADAKRERVPLFVAVSAAQTLHAFISSNSSSHVLLLQSPLLPSITSILSTSTPPTQKTARTDSHAAVTPESDAEDWLQLRVLSFGILLELTKAGGKGLGREEMRDALKESQGLLVSLVGTDLNAVAEASVQTHKEMDPKLLDAPGAGSTGQALKLASIERQLSTLQLSLEILGEWCASLDAEGLGSMDEEEEEEEWGGIAVDGEGDVEMGSEEDEGPEDGVFKKELPAEEDGMMGDDEPTVELSSSALSLFSDLAPQLLKLAHPTSLSFVRQPTESTAAPSTLLPTSDAAAPATPPTDLPAQLHPISEILTALHVRSLECLNNLYITLARASASPSVSSFLSSAAQQSALQKVWETTLSLVQAAADGAPAIEAGKESEMDEVEMRKMEVVGAGVGAAWGMARIGLVSPEDDEPRKLVVGPSTTPFLVELFSHPYATVPTPAGEAVRVRIAGALGWIGRREGVSAEENESIGLFLLSLLPLNAKTPSPLNPTPEVLLQAIDSLIDLYSDEDSPYDAPVFRAKNFLARLESAVGGVRAATKKIDRKKFPELRSRADGALENLVGFVGYRKEVQ